MKTGDMMLCAFAGEAVDPPPWYPGEIIRFDFHAREVGVRLLDTGLTLTVAVQSADQAWSAVDSGGQAYQLLVHDTFTVDSIDPATPGDMALLALADGSRFLCRVESIAAAFNLKSFHPPYPTISVDGGTVVASTAPNVQVAAAVVFLKRCTVDAPVQNEAFDNATLLEIANTSPIKTYAWQARGRAPVGYIQGMALSFCSCYRLLIESDPLVAAMTVEVTSDLESDALAWFFRELNAVGLDCLDSKSRLVAVFTVLLGLGMRESSGNHCVGRDMAATNTSASTAEAGLFQVAFNSVNANPLLQSHFEQYRGRTELLDIFSRGVHCSANDWANTGVGPGRDFQQLTKDCPLYAVMHAAVVLRYRRRHWGPVNKKTLEIKAEAAQLFNDLAYAIDASGP